MGTDGSITNEGDGYAIEGYGLGYGLGLAFDKAIAEFGKSNFVKALVKEGWDG